MSKDKKKPVTSSNKANNTNNSKNKYKEKIKVDASFAELMNIAANPVIKRVK